MTIQQLFKLLHGRRYRCYYRFHTFVFEYRNINEFDVFVDSKYFDRFSYECVENYYDYNDVDMFVFLDDLYFYRNIMNCKDYCSRLTNESILRYYDRIKQK